MKMYSEVFTLRTVPVYLRFFEQEIERFASAKDHNLSSLFIEFKAKQ